MRKILASAAVAGAALLIAAPAMSADMPIYPDIPEVDYDIGGSFYLRGSAALNWHWAPEVAHPYDETDTDEVVAWGYGYSWGSGFGYETGTGLRFDGTIDGVETAGLKITKDDGGLDDGDYTLMLRSTVALANVYYDFGLGGDWGYSAGAGGAFGYVGAGAGVAFNSAETNSPLGVLQPVPTGTNVSAAGAVMAGVGYDMGDWVADVGYRGLYINQINNAPTDPETESYYEIDNNWIHELRTTVRYRFN
ncbi:MAG: outer membrane protein [Devosia sp.]